MLQKEDLAHQPDESISNSRKWFKRLTIIFIAVLLLTMFGLGGYWLGAKQQQFLPPGLRTDPESNQLLTASPVQQLQSSHSKESVYSNKFDPQQILSLISFYNSKGTKKFLIHYIPDKNQGGYRSIYLADTTLDWQSGVKVIDVDFQDIGNSPFVSYGTERKYIAIELAGTDTADLAIADENGKLITKNVLKTNNFKFKEQGLLSYLMSFDQWDSPDTFWAQASPYGSPSDPDRPKLKLLVDAKTGSIIESSKLCPQSQDLSSKVLPH